MNDEPIAVAREILDLLVDKLGHDLNECQAVAAIVFGRTTAARLSAVPERYREKILTANMATLRLAIDHELESISKRPDAGAEVPS